MPVCASKSAPELFTPHRHFRMGYATVDFVPFLSVRCWCLGDCACGAEGGGVRAPVAATALVELAELVEMFLRSLVISPYWVVVVAGSTSRMKFLFVAAESRDLKWLFNCLIMYITVPWRPVPVAAPAREE